MMSLPNNCQSGAGHLDNLSSQNTDIFDNPLRNTSIFDSKSSISIYSAKKTSSVELSEEIKRLETEGQRLINAGRMSKLDQSYSSFAPVELSPVKDTEGHVRSPQVSSRMLSKSTSSPAEDLQTDQHTVQDLRSQLELQQREMDRLERQMSGDSPAPCLPLSSALNLASSSYSSQVGGASTRPVTMISQEYTDTRQRLKLDDVGSTQSPVTSDVSMVLTDRSDANSLLSCQITDTRLSSGNPDVRLHSGITNSRLPYGNILSRLSPVTTEVTDPRQLPGFTDTLLPCTSSSDFRLPSGVLNSQLTSLRRTQEPLLPPSHLEKSLKESQEQVFLLRKQLLQLGDTCEKQKREFRSTIEDLKGQLHDAVTRKKQIVELKDKEGRAQVGVIVTLESRLKELEMVNKQQQTVISENAKRMESLNHQGYMSDSALTQIRLLLADVERRRGKMFNQSEPMTKQNPSMLIESFEKCLLEFDQELQSKQFHINKLTSNLEQRQMQHTETINTLTQDHQDRISQMAADHSKQIESTRERATNARDQSTSLQSQLDLLQQQFEIQLKLKGDTISAQESQLEHLQQQHNGDNLSWNQKNCELSEKLSRVESELSAKREENERLTSKLSEAETKLQENKTCISELRTELDDVHEKYLIQENTCAELLISKEKFEKEVENQHREITHHEKLLSLAKRESELQHQSETATIEKCEQQKSSEKIGSLENQLSVMTNRAERAELELGESCTQVNTLQLQVTKLSDRLQVTLSELEANTDSKDHADKQLEERKAELEQKCEEADYYRHLVEEKNSELGEIRVERDKLLVQLQGNDRNLKTIYQQSTNLSQIVEINSKNSESVQREKDNLMEKLTNQTKALEETKLVSDNYVKKLKSREKRLKELEEEKKNFKCKLADKYQEVLKIKAEKEKDINSFQKYKYHVTIISKEKDQILSSLRSEKSTLDKQLKKLSSKLKVLEEELSLTQKTIQSKTSVDNKAVKVADKMQKEVTAKRGEIDKLYSKVHWLEESVDGLIKEKKSTEVKCEGLQEDLVKVTEKNNALSKELSQQKRKHEDLKYKIQTLQSGLEKAAVKNSCAQREAEGLSQEIARLKLNHQLEMKESKSCNSSAKSDGSSLQTKYSQRIVSESQQSTPTNQQVSNNMNDLPGVEVFREIGVQLTSLLAQVKSLVSCEGGEASSIQSPKINSSNVEIRPVSQWELEAKRLKNTVSSPYLHLNTVGDKMKKPDTYQSFGESADTPGFISAAWTCDNTQSESSMEEPWQQSHSTPYSGHTNVRKTTLTSAAGDLDSLPCTLELCKRLEAKMQSLSEMGGNLQRENQEMADLIQVQGKKIQQVRNTNGKFHKKR